MENSSKALLIAAAVLIVVLIVTMSMKILSPVEGTSEKAEEIGETMSGASESAVGKLQSSLGTSTGTQQPGKEENKTVKVGEIVKENSTINGQACSSNNPIIPAGFMAINTETSSWGDGTSEPEVDKGLVISDENSEFVWVPVEEDISSDKYKVDGREPDVVTGSDGKSYDADEANLILAGCTDLLTADDFKIQLENEFESMVKSVNKYGGFYVGRYETSINGGKAQSRKGIESATSATDSANKWYGLYNIQKTYITSSVRSSMIWGRQYEAMMEWMKNAVNVDKSIGDSRNTTRISGSVETDVIKNVYDLYGNVLEWTLEANNTNRRVGRGGFYNISKSPSNRGDFYSTNTSSMFGSRLTLYIWSNKNQN